MTKTIRFKVKGKGAFPFDMLRYDGCYPSTSDDVHLMLTDRTEPLYREFRTIELTTNDGEPTAARWNSFGWQMQKEF